MSVVTVSVAATMRGTDRHGQAATQRRGDNLWAMLNTCTVSVLLHTSRNCESRLKDRQLIVAHLKCKGPLTLGAADKRLSLPGKAATELAEFVTAGDLE